MADFPSILRFLDNIGIMDAVLPFLLVFTITFAILQKTQVLGEGKKNFNVILALILGMMFVIPHIMGRYPAGSDPVVIVNSALPSVSVVMIAVFAVLLIVGIFGGSFNVVNQSLAGWAALFAFGAVIYIFGQAAGWFGQFPPILDFLNDADTQALLVMILVFAIIIFFITSDGNDEKRFTGPFAKIIDAFQKSVK